MLGQYGRKVLVLESHYAAGGAAHGFEVDGFKFDTGPSFFCGMTETGSLNPVKMVLSALGETLPCVSYDKFIYHFPSDKVELPVFGDWERYLDSVRSVSQTGARQLQRLRDETMDVYQALKGIPTMAIRADWKAVPLLLSRYPMGMLRTAKFSQGLQEPFEKLTRKAGVTDPLVSRLIDLECFLLSGLKASGTVTAEMVFMFGERECRAVEYPKNGAVALVDALVRGIVKHGGSLRTKAHVEKILVRNGKAYGVRLRSGEELFAESIVSNASLWDTYGTLLEPTDLPTGFVSQQLKTPTVESFMHLHLGINAEGLEHLEGHHVVVHDTQDDITRPGNAVMISVASKFDPSLAPTGKHVVHAYTLEPFDGWKRDSGYRDMKRQKAEPLFRALRHIIPDLESRIEVERIGTPLTHQTFLRRHKGTYGPAIKAGEGLFPGPKTPIEGLWRVGDSVVPGIGVPAVVGSGVICANTMVPLHHHIHLLDRLAL
mmetsp:Transcript_6409/g.12804  ORF Transcript_6409/g.12804 Transcript_6409/m.12804 type:complete len:487 (-) Transcript_6409:142-1602(-)